MRAALMALVASVCWIAIAHAHAALVVSDPVERVALGDTPTAVRLTFSERPDPALSQIRVLDATGGDQQLGHALANPEDPLTLYVNVRPLDRGVYTVSWRAVSAIDAHASEGSYVFGVRVEPAAGPASTPATLSVSFAESAARWIFIIGLVALIGATAAAVARFGGGVELPLAAGGCAVALAGVVLLAFAQAWNARVSPGAILATDVGHALLWRGAALAAAAIALGYRAMGAALIAALAAVALHVVNGHAGAADRWLVPMVVSQWAHFSAAGVWFGGLAALLSGIRGQPAPAKADAARRFSRIAASALVVVAVTGIVRTLGEVSAWRYLTTTPYGLAVTAKLALSVAIVGFAAVNHWRSLPAAATDLRPLRRAGGGELALAVCAFAAAALLGALPPPAAALKSSTGLVASGVDYATTIRVQLTTPSNQPGPNRFVIRATDYDSGQPIDTTSVSLQFTPVDDPEIAPTLLDLSRAPDDSFAASGANIAFGGRWRITARIERNGDSTEVPMVVETAAPQQFLAVARPPGEPPSFRVQVIGIGHVWISPDPERAGRSSLAISFWDLIQDAQPMHDIVVTLATPDDREPREQPVKRTGRSTFVALADLRTGVNRIAVVGRSESGKRVRAVLNLQVPR